MSKQIPMIFKGGFSDNWYVATRWKQIQGGNFEALEKFDVTDQVRGIIEREVARSAETDAAKKGTQS